MFAREKRIGPYTYVYLVENVREAGRTKQRIIANLGRKEVADARGDLDRLTRSLARLAQRSLVLSAVDGEVPPGVACQRIGPALLFERLWQQTGCRDVLNELAMPRAVRVCRRARRISDRPAPAVRVGLGPGGGEMARRLPH